MIEPNVVLATTNVKHLNAHGWSAEPLSIARRFNVTITQELRPEYIGPDGLMDKKKVRAAFDGVGFPDYALFTIQEARAEPNVHGVGVNYATLEFEGKLLEKVDIRTLLAFLNVMDVDRDGNAGEHEDDDHNHHQLDEREALPIPE